MTIDVPFVFSVANWVVLAVVYVRQKNRIDREAADRLEEALRRLREEPIHMTSCPECGSRCTQSYRTATWCGNCSWIEDPDGLTPAGRAKNDSQHNQT